MSYLIGVDGGGSKTTALIAGLDGAIIGRGISGSSNYRAAGIESACQALDEALRAAFAAANLALQQDRLQQDRLQEDQLQRNQLQPDQVQMACFGLAGVDRPGDQAPLQAWAERQWPGMPVEFVSDARLVMAAGTPQGWGIEVICGTGSIVYGRSPEGQTRRAGGWGYLLGDEGSGYDIGLTALRCVARADDGRGPQTTLTGRILARWSLAAARDLVGYVYGPQVSKTEIAALAVLVERAALEGDSVAQQILRQAGRELATGAQVVVERLQLPEPTPCALAGGVLVQGELVSQELLTAASELGLQLFPVQKVTEPAQGAIRLAAERLRQA